jgi:hypothetical protein
MYYLHHYEIQRHISIKSRCLKKTCQVFKKEANVLNMPRLNQYYSQLIVTVLFIMYKVIASSSL